MSIISLILYFYREHHTDVEDFVFEYPESVVVVGEGEKIELFEGVYADVYYIPGYDESCLCYEIGEDMFTGDAFIPGVKTLTTFPHSSKKVSEIGSMNRFIIERYESMVRPCHLC